MAGVRRTWSWAITPQQRRRRWLWREIGRVARDDLRQVADSIAALEQAVESHGGGPRDTYYEAVALHAQAEERLAVAQSIADVREIAGLAARARYAIVCAQARLDGRAAPEDAIVCFFDPAHGPAERTVVFAPDGGQMQKLRACAACAEEIDAGRAPPSRKTIVDGRPQPYWRSPAHAGYFGAAGKGLDDLLLTGAAGLSSGDGIGLFDWLDDLLDLPHHH